MRKVIYAMSVSLDGFIEATDGELRWSYPDEELHLHFNQQEQLINLHLYGRGLYENMVSYWPTAGADPSAPQVEREYARLWKDMPKVVFFDDLDRGRLEFPAGQRRYRCRGQPVDSPAGWGYERGRRRAGRLVHAARPDR